MVQTGMNVATIKSATDIVLNYDSSDEYWIALSSNFKGYFLMYELECKERALCLDETALRVKQGSQIYKISLQ